jgi:circadian clock protein KaiC
MELPTEHSLQETPTGIEGLDEITNGRLPTGRTSLVYGSAGSGKTVLGMEFLVYGILDHRRGLSVACLP